MGEEVIVKRSKPRRRRRTRRRTWYRKMFGWIVDKPAEHPIWKIAQVVTIVAVVTGYLMVTAKKFDDDEKHKITFVTLAASAAIGLLRPRA
jgi:undecaprenyl pyrophosphate phosphatase UppP